MMKQKKISIKDIATIAGISVSSVSRILNKSGRYSKETEARVLKIVEEYGYITNMAAKSLRSMQSKSIGLMVPDITNEFFAKIAYFCEKYLHSKGYTLFICNTNNSSENEYLYLNDFISKNIDGIIAISTLTKVPKSLVSAKIPIVALDRIPKCKIPIPYIISDEKGGSYSAAELLIKKGCKHIIVIVPKAQENNSNKKDYRLLGAKAALNAYNIPFEINKSAFFINISNQSVEEAEELMFNLLKNKNTIDGVICGSDRIALGVSRAINICKLKIPQDIKIIGFDNTVYSQLAIPPISTVERNSKSLSIKACDLLLDIINHNDEQEFKFIKEPTKIIERESTKTI